MNRIVWVVLLNVVAVCTASDLQPGLKLVSHSENDLPLFDLSIGITVENGTSLANLESSLGQNGPAALFVRQNCPVPCGGNTCCRAGEDCVPGGCCPTGEVRCGNSRCHNPLTSKCCTGSGKAWACGVGASCCSTPGLCFDETSHCCPDGQRSCLNTEDCVDGGCCPLGNKRCGNSKCYNPKTTKCCTSPGKVWPCELDESCCGTPGVCANLETEKCCEAGSCPLASGCCANQCCKPGALCGTDGRCAWPATPTPSPSSKSPSSTSRSAAPSETADEPEEPDLPDPSSTTSDLPAASSTGCSTLLRRELAERQREDDGQWGPKFCIAECDVATRQEAFVWEITPKKGETDELIKSMCAGIQAHNDRRRINDPGFKPVDGEDLLTYDGGKTVDPTGNDERRKETKCGDFCAHLNVGLGRKWEWECDEYPPASMIEGGSLSTRVCIPRYQNSKTQGPMLSRLISACKLSGKSNQKIKVRIVGGCKDVAAPESYQFPPLLRGRAETTTTVDLSDSNSTLRNPDADGNLKYVAADFDNLADGTYNVKLTFDGVIERAAIINKYGDEYSSVENPTGDATFSFTINDGLNLSAAVIAVTNKAVNLSYSGTAQLTTPTQVSPSAAATTTSGSTPLRHTQDAFNLAGIGCLCLLFTFGLFL